MADKIKAFFKQKKAEAKFKIAGGGQKLGDATTAAATSRKGNVPRKPAERQHPSGSSQQAGAAALNRFQSQEDRQGDPMKKRQQARIREQAKRELEKEKEIDKEIARVKETYGDKSEEIIEAPTASGGVYYRCSLVGEEVYCRDEMKKKIKEFLYSQLDSEERCLTAVLIIHTCNSPRERVSTCVETLGKYIDNVVSNPTELKYRKIRKSNKAFQERVASLEGTSQFLEGCGFISKQMEGTDGVLEDFWIFPEENTNIELLGVMIDSLRGAEPVVAELDRATKIIPPGEKFENRKLPCDFFNITSDEVKKEQERRSEVVEREGMLRTKAMREKEEMKSRRKYKYCLIRVRFPDGWVIQGTFSVLEPLSAVSEFVSEHLDTPLPHQLADSVTGIRFQEDGLSSSLLDIGLVPATLLNFCWEPEIEADLASTNNTVGYLREDLIKL